MSSIVPNYEYDIFISYRQNDNAPTGQAGVDGWVTHFVKDLEQELRGVLKNPVSIYFDQNAHDGLLETHSVDKSLEGKLRSLIFIPVLSQTYCDQKSFAWQHELCAFNRLLKEDQIGRDIRLSNGNVASRILPVKIHDLDEEDKALLEKELGGALRAVDFIYKEPGVNRPLKPTDNKQDNLHKTDYRNQVNKVANAVKELLAGITHGRTAWSAPVPVPARLQFSSTRRRTLIAGALVLVMSLGAYGLYNFGGSILSSSSMDRSIAVLPFENMSDDVDQDYFSNGITEDILNHLVKIADLKVKSRTSTLQYKGTQKSMIEIGQELSVKHIVEGSVRRVGNQVRVVVQLIDSEADVHMWSETYDRQLEDVLALQSEIAFEIANALKAQLSSSEKQNIEKIASTNVFAYDRYLRAKATIDWGNFNKSSAQIGLRLIDEAIQLDPMFSRAYAFKGLSWYYQRYFGVSQKLWQDSAIFYSNKAIDIDPNSPDGYLVQARIHETTGNHELARKAISKAYELAPNDPDALDAQGYRMLRDGNAKGAELALRALASKYSPIDPRYYIWLGDIHRDMGEWSPAKKLYAKAKGLDPGLMDSYWRLSSANIFTDSLDRALMEATQADQLNPGHPGVINELGWIYYLKRDLNTAAKYWGRYPELESQFAASTQYLPFRHCLAMVYREMGREKEADALVSEELKGHLEVRSGKRGLGVWLGVEGLYYDIGIDYAYFGDNDKAIKYLDSAVRAGFLHYQSFHGNPMLVNLKDREDFKRLQKAVADYSEFNKSAFTPALSKWQGAEDLKRVLTGG